MNNQAIEFPIKTGISSKVINSLPTDITVQGFSNCLFVLVSQCQGQTGTVVELKSDKPLLLQTCTGEFIGDLDFNVLFGIETPEILLAARIFGEAIRHQSSLTIIFALAIKDFSKDTLKALTQELVSTLKKIE